MRNKRLAEENDEIDSEIKTVNQVAKKTLRTVGVKDEKLVKLNLGIDTNEKFIENPENVDELDDEEVFSSDDEIEDTIFDMEEIFEENSCPAAAPTDEELLFGWPISHNEKMVKNFKISAIPSQLHNLTEDDIENSKIEYRLSTSYKLGFLGKSQLPQKLKSLIEKPNPSDLVKSIIKYSSKSHFSFEYKKMRLHFIKQVGRAAAAAGRKRMQRISPDTYETERKKRCVKIAKMIKSFWNDLKSILDMQTGELKKLRSGDFEDNQLDDLVQDAEKIAEKIQGNETNEELLELRKEQDSDMFDLLKSLPQEMLPAGYTITQNEVRPVKKRVTRSSGQLDSQLKLMSEALEPPKIEDGVKNSELVEVSKLLFRGELRHYQRIGLHWLYKLHESDLNGMLADEMGLGKTIQTIALFASLASEKGNWGPHLVIAPSSVVMNWEMELKRFLPGFKTMVYLGDRKKRSELRKGVWKKKFGFNVCLTSYAIAAKDQRILRLRPWSYLVLDEAHQIKNWKSERFRLLYGLAQSCKNRLLLTGTPLQNNLEELWALLHFIMPVTFAERVGFAHWFGKPLSLVIHELGMDDDEDDEASKGQKVIKRLHTCLRPFLLRRLKVIVTKELPQKHEHVIYCELSKRQRILYQEFLSREDTQNKLKFGSYVSVLGCLMNLRKVCNHPDLFTERDVSMPYFMNGLMPEILNSVKFKNLNLTHDSPGFAIDWCAVGTVERDFSGKNLEKNEFLPENLKCYFYKKRLDNRLDKHANEKVYRDIFNGLEIVEKWWQNMKIILETSKNPDRLFQKLLNTVPESYVDTVYTYSIQRHFLLYIPSVQVSYIQASSNQYLTNFSLRSTNALKSDFSKLSNQYSQNNSINATISEIDSRKLPGNDFTGHILFPERRLIQYDCGKLQTLQKMLRSLKEDGHRCLIFSQMSKMLNILEKFLSYHGYTYLRLDGKLKPEDRMSVMERFNYDKRIFILLLSTRAGGLGVNLIGADTVIFYDSDWNPQIDAQAQDRCHRIGQTKEVNVYRMISESTVEERILETANKKRVLADLAIEQGQFSGGSLFSRNAMVKDLLGEDLEGGGGEEEEDVRGSGSCSRAESPSDQLKMLEKVEDEDDALEKRDLDAEIRKIKEVDDADMNLEQLKEGEREIKEKYEMIIESLNPLSKRCLRLIEDETVNSAQTIIM